MKLLTTIEDLSGSRVWQSLPEVYRLEVCEVLSGLAAGQPLPALQACKIRSSRNHWRIRIGRAYRLVIEVSSSGARFQLVTRQDFERVIGRR